MQVKILWKDKKAKELINKVKISIDELWLTDFIKIKDTNSKKLKEELNIKKEPALIIIEESIDFKDVIFEWIIPKEEELKSMFISIIWWESNIWCSTDDCFSWCSWC